MKHTLFTTVDRVLSHPKMFRNEVTVIRSEIKRKNEHIFLFGTSLNELLSLEESSQVQHLPCGQS